jgi:hypothetical protein
MERRLEAPATPRPELSLDGNRARLLRALRCRNRIDAKALDPGFRKPPTDSWPT